MDVAIFAAGISALSLLIAFASWFGKSKQDEGIEKKEVGVIITKLDFLSEDIKDIKADQRSVQRNLNEVRKIAMSAESKAEAAHTRLDRAGIEVGTTVIKP